MTRAERLLAECGLAALALTVSVIVAPWARFAYDNLSLHVALETAEALAAGLLAFLAYLRFRRTRTVSDLALAVAFGVLGLTNIALSAVPAIALEARPVGVVTWTTAALRLLGAGGLAVAAFGSTRLVAPLRRPALLLRALVVILAVVVGAIVADAVLADAIDPRLSPATSTRPRVGHPAVYGLQLGGFALYSVAATMFVVRARRTGDQLLWWLGTGAMLAAFARVHYFLFPSLYSNWVYTGDVLRFAGYVAFVCGAVQEIRAYWRAQTSSMLAEERERLARDLHDGLVQEVSFIRSQSSTGRALDGPQLEHVAAAADRALSEARHALMMLTGGGDESTPLTGAIRVVAEQVAGRAGAAVEVHGDATAAVPGSVRDAIVRVVREAVTNAVRHGEASNIAIAVGCEGDGCVTVTVSDDGRGFDPSAVTVGFGLRSMRARAAAAGGSLTVRSAAEGTTVEARFGLR